MRALLVDIGNSRIKWAWLTDGRLGKAQAAEYSGWRAQDFARRIHRARAGISIASWWRMLPRMRSAMLWLRARAWREHREPERIATQRQACGVTVGYIDPWRLGVDRLLAMIGAHQRFAGRPVCTVAVGTAMTVDLMGGGRAPPWRRDHSGAAAHGLELARQHERHSPPRTGWRRQAGRMLFLDARPGRRSNRGPAMRLQRPWTGPSSRRER